MIGVSFDTAESHRKFIARHRLNLGLIADPQGKIASAYGAKMADREMARRVNFLIGMDGTILHVTDTPSAETHLAEMKSAIERLKRGLHSSTLFGWQGDLHGTAALKVARRRTAEAFHTNCLSRAGSGVV